MILIIDNYDSFTYNLYQFIGSITDDIKVIRNDEMTVEQIRDINPSKIIISPGPGYPKDAGVCIDVVKKLKGSIPILGVCLGHQAICESYGGKILHAKKIMHGKQSNVVIDKDCPLFYGLRDSIKVGRYHSLSADKNTLPKELDIIASSDDGEIMGVMDKKNKVYGVQFHPESILTPDGMTMLKNFIEI